MLEVLQHRGAALGGEGQERLEVGGAALAVRAHHVHARGGHAEPQLDVRALCIYIYIYTYI